MKVREKERNELTNQDMMLGLQHQIIAHASDTHLGVKRMMGKLRTGKAVGKDEWIDFLERVSFHNSLILTASRSALKGDYGQRQRADLVGYIREYINTVACRWAPNGISIDFHDDGKQIECSFRKIHIGLAIDNIICNAARAGATRIGFFTKVNEYPEPALSIIVADDGPGWPDSLSSESIFEKGVTTTDGSGLGLYHLKKVIEDIGGRVEARKHPLSKDLDGAHLNLRIPSVEEEISLQPSL